MKIKICFKNKEDVKESFKRAMKELSHSAFKLYCLLLQFNDDDIIDLRPNFAIEETGVCEKSFRNGIKDLKEKGYIVNYTFYNSSQAEAVNKGTTQGV